MKGRINIGPAELETFLAIAELGSFSKAAERLSLAQPSISNRVQRLERAVRARLFERTTRAVVLTPAGERLRERVEPVVRSLQQILDEFCGEAERRSQMVVVATTPMLATVLLPPIIHRFTTENPSARVELQDQVTAQLASDIRSGRVDFAILALRPPIEGIEFSLASESRFMVVGPRGHPAFANPMVSLAALASAPFLLLEAYRQPMEPLYAWGAERGLVLSPARTVTNVSTLLGMVAEGMGLTLLPNLVLRIGGAIDDSRFEVAPLDGPVLVRKYGIASLAGHDWSPMAKAFATTLRTELRTHSAKGARDDP